MTGKDYRCAKKSLGQNFLISRAVQQKIVDAVSVERGECVFEIGAGRGALSIGLVERGARLVAIETDRGLVEELKRRLKDFESGEVLLADIRDVNLDEEALSRGVDRYKVVGNIPYYLTSTILLKLSILKFCRSAVLMMQREVADRIVAEPGSRACGTFTVLMQSYFEIERLFRVKPGSFRPSPKVESAVCAFTPAPKEGAPEQRMEFFALLKKTFSMRRKKLETIMRKAFGIDIDASDRKEIRMVELLRKRPEELGLEEWYELFRRVRQSGSL